MASELIVITRRRVILLVAVVCLLVLAGRQLRTRGFCQMLSDDPGTRKSAIARSMGRSPNSAVNWLVKRLSSSDASPAMRALEEIGIPAVSSLHRAFKGSRPFSSLISPERNNVFKAQIATLLGRIGDARSVPILMAEMKGEASLLRMNEPKYGRLRSALAESLAAFGAQSAPALLETIAAQEIPAMQDAVEALLLMDPEYSVPPLIDALSREDLRYPGVELLGLIGDERAVPALISMMYSGKREPRYEVALALLKIGGNEAENTLQQFDETNALSQKVRNYRELIREDSNADWQLLCYLLWRFGDSDMARVYSECGRQGLAGQAESWARQRKENPAVPSSTSDEADAKSAKAHD